MEGGEVRTDKGKREYRTDKERGSIGRIKGGGS